MRFNHRYYAITTSILATTTYSTTTCLAFALRTPTALTKTTTTTGLTMTTAAASATTNAAVRTALDESAKDGAFVRKDSAYRNWISKGTLHTQTHTRTLTVTKMTTD